jgi:hypothetical protein
MISFGSVSRMLLGSDNNEVVFPFGPFRRWYRKRRKSASICFHKDPTKAAIYVYFTSQPEMRKDEVVKSRPA